jgi:hypothetical protein
MGITTNYDLIEICDKLKIPLVGVFSKDELKRKNGKVLGGGYIINLKSSNDGEGEVGHWTAFYISPNGNTCYFDPFGFEYPKEVYKYLKKNIPYSDKHIQNINSGVCGYYCIAFLHYMYKNQSKKNMLDNFNDFLDMFSDNPLENREILQDYLRPL